VENIPEEWKKIFASAGIKKKELRDPEAAKFIMSVVVTAAAAAADTTAENTPPTAGTKPSP
jgi:hypothetical protein